MSNKEKEETIIKKATHLIGSRTFYSNSSMKQAFHDILVFETQFHVAMRLKFNLLYRERENVCSIDVSFGHSVAVYNHVGLGKLTN